MYKRPSFLDKQIDASLKWHFTFSVNSWTICVADQVILNPFKATTYSLQAEREELRKFRTDAAAELTVEVEQEKKYDMEIPLNVLRENVAGVNSVLNLQRLKV